jgi:hypothetical protein
MRLSSPPAKKYCDYHEGKDHTRNAARNEFAITGVLGPLGKYSALPARTWVEILTDVFLDPWNDW